MSDVPVSSYSDPIYDRLDLFAQHLRRQWPVYLLGVVAVTVIVVLAAKAGRSHPEAAAAAALTAALDTPDPAARITALQGVAADGSAPGVRALAQNEIARLTITGATRDLAAAAAAAAIAVTEADRTTDTNLPLTARLSQAAILLESGKAAEAEAAYREVVARAGSVVATATERTIGLIGAAQAMVAQGPQRRADAAELLVPLLSASDSGSSGLIEAGRLLHWRLKREAAAAAAVPAADTTAPVQADAPAAIPADGAGTASAPAGN
jgi:hypothetical protein